MARPKKAVAKTTENYLNKIETEIQSNQSRLNMVLGALIVLVVGILVFNYFNRSKSDLGPAQNIETSETQDVTTENLPGKYTVKEGDTLFTIAEKYYQDGYQYSEIAKANNISNPDSVEVGQILKIPKLELTTPETSPEESIVMPEPTNAPVTEQPSDTAPGSKGAPDITMMQQDWGSNITSSTYTVVEGDWLSTIAGRAYGDITLTRKSPTLIN